MCAYYFYMALMKYDLFKSAVSYMPVEAAHDSEMEGSSTSATQKGRGSTGGSGTQHGRGGSSSSSGAADGDVDNKPIVIARSADHIAIERAKRKVVENPAMLSNDDAIEAIFVKLRKAEADLEEHEDAFLPSLEADFWHQAKKTRVEKLKANLSELMK
mmetsp:Transcript_4379/g.8427  ORF Transcript_4379/g.8427 Transcript_4379/m.8427 type:complete len:158 (-) Transcript_4379:124-597(-)